MDRSTRVLLGLTLTTGTAASVGCGGAQRGPAPTLRADGLPLDVGGSLTIEGARFLSPQHVELRLSRPVSPVEAVDPAQFRLSAARGQETTSSYGYGYGGGRTYTYASTQYDEIASVQCRYRGDNRYGYYGYAYDYTCYESGPIRVVSLAVPDDREDTIVLTLSPAIDPEFLQNVCDGTFEENRCRYYDDYYYGMYGYGSESDTQCDAALFVHYAGDADGVTAQDGTPLEAISSDWAQREPTTYDSDYRSEYFPELDIRRAIRCTPAVSR